MEKKLLISRDNTVPGYHTKLVNKSEESSIAKIRLAFASVSDPDPDTVFYEEKKTYRWLMKKSKIVSPKNATGI